MTQNICQYRSLQYSRAEGPDSGLPEEALFGAYQCSVAFHVGQAGRAAVFSS